MNTYTQPFSPVSPWNTELCNPRLTSVGTDLSANITNPTVANWPGAGWVSVYKAKPSDPSVQVLFNSNAYTNLANGTWKSFGNSAMIEAAILASSSSQWPYSWNPYSTTDASGVTHTPPSIFHAQQNFYWTSTPQVPANAVPCPGADSHMAVFQTNGWVLETFGTIILSSGVVVCFYASFSDSSSCGDGQQSGRRSSMIPNYAGLIRKGEYTAGTITHALALDLPQSSIARSVVYPALALDNGNNYTGTAIPFGSRLALPQSLSNSDLGLTTKLGFVIAEALRVYGAYVVDSTAPGTSIFDSEVAATDLPGWSGPAAADLQLIMNALLLVS